MQNGIHRYLTANLIDQQETYRSGQGKASVFEPVQ